MSRAARIGVDVGGTFTDVVLALPDGRIHVNKTTTTPADPGEGVAAGVAAVLAEARLDPRAVAEVVHGTTVASNTILQKVGARTGLLTTRGFRDVLEIGRIRTPGMFDMTWSKPEPLVPRRWRLEAHERIGAEGNVVVPLDEASVREAAAIIGMRLMGRSTREPDPADPRYVRLSVPFDWEDQAETVAFGLARFVDVVGPADLRARVLDAARAVLARYAGVSDEDRAAEPREPALLGSGASG